MNLLYKVNAILTLSVLPIITHPCVTMHKSVVLTLSGPPPAMKIKGLSRKDRHEGAAKEEAQSRWTVLGLNQSKTPPL